MGPNFLLVNIFGNLARLRDVVVTYCLTVFHEMRERFVLPIYIRSWCFLINGTAGYDIKWYDTEI